MRNLRTSDITFTWDKALAFNGNSAPYIQYAFTRIHSLITKAKITPVFENIVITNEKEREIVKHLYQYGKILNWISGFGRSWKLWIRRNRGKKIKITKVIGL